MADISLTIKSNFEQASKDLKEFGTVTAATKAKIDKFVNSFKEESINNFISRQDRAKAAVTATRGPVEALTAQHRAYQREIERLIRNGLDPMDDKLKPLIANYKKLEQEIEDNVKAQKKASQASPITVASLLYIGQAAFNVGQKIFDMGMEFVEAGSDAEETANKFNVVFQGIENDANDATKALTDGFGLSHQAAQDLLAGTGDILTGFGFTKESALDLSLQVNTLAADLASFTNYEGGTEGASKALTKALLGEAESVKALGIVIRQDTKDYKERVATIMEVQKVDMIQAKALAALQIATEQSKNAIGDFERSIDSYANQARITESATADLKDQIGEYLLPAATRGQTAFGNFARSLADVVEEANNFRDVVKLWEEGATSQEQIATAFDTTNDKINEQREKLAALQAQNDEGERTRGSTGARLREREKEIEATEKEIASLQTQLEWLKEVQDQKDDLTRAEQAKLEVINELADSEGRLKELRNEALSDDEKKIQSISEEIDALAALRTEAKEYGLDYSELQQLINELDAERKELLKDDLEDGTEWTREAAEARAQAWSDEFETEQQILADKKAANEKYNDEQLELLDERVAKEVEKEKEKYEKMLEAANDYFNSFSSIMDSISTIISNRAAKEIAAAEEVTTAQLVQLETQLQAELEAAGVAELTTREKLEQQLEDAFAAGDAETAKELQDEIKRLDITKKYSDKKVAIEEQALKDKSLAEYEAATASWKIQVAQATAGTAIAVINALQTKPFMPAGLIAAGVAGVAGAAQMVAVGSAKPDTPVFQTGTMPSGYTVPESASARGDSQYMRVNPGEQVNVTPRGESGGDQNIFVQVGEDAIYSIVNKGFRNGDIYLTEANLRRGA